MTGGVTKATKFVQPLVLYQLNGELVQSTVLGIANDPAFAFESRKYHTERVMF